MSRNWRMEDDQGCASPRPAFLPVLLAAPLVTGRQAHPTGGVQVPQASEHVISRRTGCSCPSQDGRTADRSVTQQPSECPLLSARLLCARCSVPAAQCLGRWHVLLAAPTLNRSKLRKDN